MAATTSCQHARRGRMRGEAVFPTQQLFVLALCRICEPIAFMSIFPYIYYMISSFNVTSDDQKIALYAGMVTSAFTFAEFSAGVVWGRLSDRIGRKPVLIGGLAGTALSMIVFGFSRSLPMALIARALGGLLNGNIGVLQTTVAELVRVKEHQPRAYSVMPFVWCLGSIIGPVIGGALAQPSLSFPSLFPEGSLFERFPFLLPNLACTGILVCGVAVGILFLEETHEQLKDRRDYGLELGQMILRRVACRKPRPYIELSTDKAGRSFPDESVLLVEDDELLPDCRSHGTSANTSRAPSPDHTGRASKLRAAQTAFTRQVKMNIVALGIMAFHAISFDQLMPVFLSEPVSHEPPVLPFKFSGGFGLSSKTIGTLLAIQGVYSMVAQLLLFPFLVKRLGTLRVFRMVVIVWPLLYLLVPYVVLLPQHLQMAAVMACLLWRITAQVLAFPSHAILLTNAAPSSLVLGLVNGVAASTASLSRALGPTISGSIHAASLRTGYTGLVWWVGGLVAAVGAIESLLIREVKGRMDVDGPEDTEKFDSELPRDSTSTLDETTIEAALLAARRTRSPSAAGPSARQHRN